MRSFIIVCICSTFYAIKIFTDYMKNYDSGTACETSAVRGVTNDLSFFRTFLIDVGTKQMHEIPIF